MFQKLVICSKHVQVDFSLNFVGGIWNKFAADYQRRNCIRDRQNICKKNLKLNHGKIPEILAHVKSHKSNTYLVFLHLLALNSLLGLHYH